MTFQVNLVPRAAEDVDEILGWIRRRSPSGAETWKRRWMAVLDDLARSADRASLAAESDDHREPIRQILFKTRRGRFYRALFVIRGNLVYVIHVRGPGQNLLSVDELRATLPDE